MSKEKTTSERQSPSPVVTQDEAIAMNRRSPSASDQIHIINESRRNYSEVDRDPAPPRPTRK